MSLWWYKKEVNILVIFEHENVGIDIKTIWSTNALILIKNLSEKKRYRRISVRK